MKLTKTEKTTGIILAVLLFLITLSSTFFFLVKLNVSWIQWISFNSCAPTSFLYLLLFLAFLIRKKATYLFVLSWNAINLIAHLGHIIMTLNLIWVVFIIIRHEEYKALGIGLLISILLFVPYIAYVLSYNQAHAEELSKLFL